MARESRGENDESEQVTLKYLFTFSKEYLAHDLSKCIEFKQDHILKSKFLERKTNF